MYRINIKGINKAHQYEELIKIFLKPEEFFIVLKNKDENASNTISVEEANKSEHTFNKVFDFVYNNDRNKLKKEIFETLYKETGNKPEWGTMTGIRPVKLFLELCDEVGSYEAEKVFKEEYCVSNHKTELIKKIAEYQKEKCGIAKEKSVGVYIGIPFCPTRCLYCSFTSNQSSQEEIQEYLDALLYEIEFAGKKVKENNLYIESIYIGGGTPTTLNENQLETLLKAVNMQLVSDDLKEFTVEAGRPDTINSDKLKLLKKYNVKRISINPQTMNDKTLKLIGRNHSSYDIETAFELARKSGIEEINVDLITALPEESLEDFKYTVEKVMNLQPDNITVHTLAVKRASRLVDINKDFHYEQSDIATKMMNFAYNILEENGYVPYYLYRQKHMAGAGENVGFCKNDTVGLYNVRIMDEHQSILALGAGGISKLYFPNENRLERVANISNYKLYIERIEEMLERKEKNFFKEG